MPQGAFGFVTRGSGGRQDATARHEWWTVRRTMRGRRLPWHRIGLSRSMASTVKCEATARLKRLDGGFEIWVSPSRRFSLAVASHRLSSKLELDVELYILSPLYSISNLVKPVHLHRPTFHSDPPSHYMICDVLAFAFACCTAPSNLSASPVASGYSIGRSRTASGWR